MLRLNKVDVKIHQQFVLTNINLSISAGKVIALLGPNGAGKSTLLKTLSQEVTYHAGTIQFHQKPLEQWSAKQLARSLAVLPQHASLTFPFRVQDVVAMGCYPLSLSQKQSLELVEHHLNNVGMFAFKERLYPSLSGGEKQRVQLARTLIQVSQSPIPPLLLLDEPTSALDLAQQHNILNLIRQLACEQQHTVVIILHDLNQAAFYADHLVIMEQGHIAIQGPPQDVLTEPIISQVWQYQPRFGILKDSTIPFIF